MEEASDEKEVGPRREALAPQDFRRERGPASIGPGKPFFAERSHEPHIDIDEHAAPGRILGHDEVARMNIEVKRVVLVEVDERVKEVEDGAEELAGGLLPRRARREGRALNVLPCVEGD